ncbi:MAG: DUF2652 domain-containing protein [Arenimonas sp.]
MESVIDRADHPLVVNKLEGDAALLYRECTAGDVAAARDVLAQVKAFFPAFHQRLAQQREQRANCSCDACSNIDNLDLKAFVHVGEFAIKQVRQFEELAGEEVILVHRLLKNHVPSRRYILMTEAVREAAAWQADDLQPHREMLEGIGQTDLWLAEPTAIPFELPERPTSGERTAVPSREAYFHHLPAAGTAQDASLLARLGRWLGRG